jgi:hypothetical protein
MKMKILQAITVAALAAAQAAALAIGGQNIMVKKSSNGLQNVVGIPSKWLSGGYLMLLQGREPS